MAMKALIGLLLIAGCRLNMFAGGSISGTVTLKSDATPLVGANVLLKGSFRGASTNNEGNFRIDDVTPGTYVVTFSLVGHQRETRSDVVVKEGQETIIDISLTQVPVATDQVVVTANKREESLQDVPASVSVMDAAEIRYRNAQTIEDAVRYIPGVNITGGQVNIRGSSGYSKGAGSRIIMLLDGVPFIAGDTGELIFESIPVGQIDRIEVVKGASSALYGSSALGGVINIITKPIREVPETYIRTYGGLYNKPTFDQWKWADGNLGFAGISIGHSQMIEDVGIALSLSRQVDDGYRKNDYTRRYNFYLKSRKDFSSENSLTVNFGLLSQRRAQFQYWRNLDSALIPPYVQRDDAIRSSRYFVSGLYSDVISDNFLLTAKAIWNHNDWMSTTWHDAPQPRWKDIQESLSNDYRLELGSTLLLGKQHTITGGVNAQYFKVDASDSLFGKHAGWSGALYGQDEWKLDEQLALTFGARLDIQSVGLVESGPQVNPKIALSYKPVEGTTLRASFGRGFRIPSVAEVFVSLDLGSGINTLPNTSLQPERSYSYEVGVVHQFTDFGSIDIAAFRSDYSNLIEPTPFIDATQNLKIQWRNTPKARVQGFETSLKMGFFDGDLLYNLGYTYAYAEDLSPDDPLFPRSTNILPYRPRHLLYTGVLAKIGIFSAGCDFRYVSRVDRVFSAFGIIVPNADERVEILVTDFRLGADFTSLGAPLTATFDVNNAFRYNYLELTANMSPPRNFVFTLEAKL